MAKPPMSGPPEKQSIESKQLREDQVAASAVALALFFAIVLPTTLTLSTVREEVVRNAVLELEASDNPTPLGYTVSLLIYLIPIATLVTWFYRTHAPGSFRRVALHRTLLTLVPIGFGLDFLLGNLIFQFPNTGAILGIYGPGYSFVTGGVVWDIPIEEFIFYVSGFFAILLAYIWNNQVWVSAYGVADYSDTSRHPPYVVQIHWAAAGIGVVLFALALFYKKVLAPVELRDGFPLYMTFLLLVAIIPGMLLHRCAQPFINWRAFGITLMWVLLTSLLWEATLASPFGWWRYEPKWMMGLHVKAWADLPVEAVALWIAVAYTTISVYETYKVALHMKDPLAPKSAGDEQSPITAA